MAGACTCHRSSGTEEAALKFDLEVAESALREGDLPHARHHVAGAMGTAPTDARTQAIAERLAQRLDLTAQLDGPAWWGEVALRACALQRVGRHEDAICLLCAVTRVAPHLGYEHLLCEWVTALPKPLSTPVAQALGQLFATLSRSTIGIHLLLDGERALLGASAGLAQLCAQLSDDGAPELVPASGLVRRAGRLREAVELANRGRGSDALVQAALALRAGGHGDEAGALFERAERELGEPGTYRVERLRCAFVAGHFEQVRRFSAGEATKDPEVTGVLEACAAPPATAHERVLALDRLRRATRLVTLSAATGATANLLEDPRLEPGSSLGTTAVSGWEPPSNRLALAVFGGLEDLRQVSYSMRFEPFERPVLAQVRGKSSLWAARDGVVVQAVPAPPDRVRTELAQVAARFTESTHQVREDLFHAARNVRSSAPELEAALVHPPASLDRRRVIEALSRYQLTAAFALTALPSHEGLGALESIIFGPIDWISGAAVIALGEWTRFDAAVANRGRALLLAALDDLLPHSCEPRFWPLFSALHSLPATPDFADQRLRAWAKAHLDPDA